jgi:hypothetical protein
MRDNERAQKLARNTTTERQPTETYFFDLHLFCLYITTRLLLQPSLASPLSSLLFLLHFNFIMSSDMPGGVKGFFMKAGKSFYAGGTVARDVSYWLLQKGGRIGLFLASTSMVVLMPLIFEINREVTVRNYLLE